MLTILPGQGAYERQEETCNSGNKNFKTQWVQLLGWEGKDYIEANQENHTCNEKHQCQPSEFSLVPIPCQRPLTSLKLMLRVAQHEPCPEYDQTQSEDDPAHA